MIQFEPKYIVELTSSKYNEDESLDLIYDKDNLKIKNKCNGILYHITTSKYYDKIINNGLIPKSGKKNIRKVDYPERIYFFPQNLIIPNDYFFINTAKQLYKSGTEIVVLKIDLYKYSKVKYKFYQDPNHPQGIFIYEPVHPICVDLYKIFIVK